MASVGNSSRAAVSYPAALAAVIAVTATDANNQLYSHANRGTQVELAAPRCWHYRSTRTGKVHTPVRHFLCYCPYYGHDCPFNQPR